MTFATNGHDHPGGPPSDHIGKTELLAASHIMKPEPRDPTLTQLSSQPPLKRPRGRPRKYPLPDPNLIKTGKIRSKTGCITCRRRKKKCDERRPTCQNCDKNALVCEGYAARMVWRGGKKTAIDRLSPPTFSHIRLGPIIHGIETEEDKVFFAHFSKLSCRCTVDDTMQNALSSLLLPLAVGNLGLMHSILSWASKDYHHHVATTSGGESTSKLYPNAISTRSQYHSNEAVKWLRASMNEKPRNEVDLAVRLGQMLCLLFETTTDAHLGGQHRLHIQAYQTLIEESPRPSTPLTDFIHECFAYHDAVDDLIFAPDLTALEPTTPISSPTYSDDDDSLHDDDARTEPDTAHFVGVYDGLFVYMNQVTRLRNTIRRNMHLAIDPVVDYQCLFDAATIDAGVRSWIPPWPVTDARHLAGLIYRQMVWVYLWRTLYPPRITTSTATTSTSPTTPPSSSPPPRPSWTPDQRILQAVSDSLEMLDSVPPTSPTQTLLLAPAFVLGCAAFEASQRVRVRRAIAVVAAYRRGDFDSSGGSSDSSIGGGVSGRFGSIDHATPPPALRVLEELWRRMDRLEEESCWDWEKVANGMGMDFLVV